MKHQSPSAHHSHRSTASSNNNRLLIYCQALFVQISALGRFLPTFSDITWRNLAFAAITLGIGIRGWLVWQNPLWSDEMYSIWTTYQSWPLVLTGSLDVVHPPGYYILLKAWMLPSDQLQWVRLFSMLAGIGSIFLVHLIGKQEEHRHPELTELKWWWPVAYSLSGFHLVFDWAGRMYALVAFMTVLQLWSIRRATNPFLIAVIAAAGLMIDYGFFWSYCMIWLLLAIITWLQPTKLKCLQLLGLTAGVIPFALWQMQRMSLFQAGINGILWMSPHLRFDFFVPFFLGTHNTVWLSVITLAVLLISLKPLYPKYQKNLLFWWWLGSSFVLLDFTLMYSAIKQPLFHPRSLQFIGLAVSFYWALLLQHKKWRLMALVLLTTQALMLVVLFNQGAYHLLIEFYPWQQIKKSFGYALKSQPNSILHIEPLPKSPSPLLTEGLLYTLQGKEKIGDAQIPYVRDPIDTMSLQPRSDCNVIWDNYALVNLCKK